MRFADSLTRSRRTTGARQPLRRTIAVGAIAVGTALALMGSAADVEAYAGSAAPPTTVRAEHSTVQLTSVPFAAGATRAVWTAQQELVVAELAAGADTARVAAAQLAAEQAAADEAAAAASAKAAADRAAAAAAAASKAAKAGTPAPTRGTAVKHAVAAPSARAIVWRTRIVNSGGQAEIDQCLGGLTRMSYSIEGKPYLTIHRGCGGAPLLRLRIGDRIAIDGAVYVVTDTRDGVQGAPVSVLYGMNGTAILQTCYSTGDTVRAVAVTPAA